MERASNDCPRIWACPLGAAPTLTDRDTVCVGVWALLHVRPAMLLRDNNTGCVWISMHIALFPSCLYLGSCSLLSEAYLDAKHPCGGRGDASGTLRTIARLQSITRPRFQRVSPIHPAFPTHSTSPILTTCFSPRHRLCARHLLSHSNTRENECETRRKHDAADVIESREISQSSFKYPRGASYSPRRRPPSLAPLVFKQKRKRATNDCSPWTGRNRYHNTFSSRPGVSVTYLATQRPDG